MALRRYRCHGARSAPRSERRVFRPDEAGFASPDRYRRAQRSLLRRSSAMTSATRSMIYFPGSARRLGCGSTSIPAPASTEAAGPGFSTIAAGQSGPKPDHGTLRAGRRTVLEIRKFLNARAGLGAIKADGLLHSLSRRLPYQAKTWLKALLKVSPLRHEAFDEEEVSFADIEARFFAGRPRCPVYSKCISSRHFDAAGTGTCQILLRG